MRAYRSPLKIFVFGIVGIVLIAAAADVAFGHWLSTPPDTHEGAMTTRGLAQQRGDLIWAGAMVVAGVLLFGGAITDLLRRKPVIAVEGDELVVDSGNVGVHIPWSDVDEVSSDVTADPFDGSPREQLVIERKPDSRVLADAPGVVSEGDMVYVDAHDWATDVTEVALAAQGALDHHRRMEAIRSYEEPSVVWEVTVDQVETEADDKGDGDAPEPEEANAVSEDVEGEDDE